VGINRQAVTAMLNQLAACGGFIIVLIVGTATTVVQSVEDPVQATATPTATSPAGAFLTAGATPTPQAAKPKPTRTPSPRATPAPAPATPAIGVTPAGTGGMVSKRGLTVISARAAVGHSGEDGIDQAAATVNSSGDGVTAAFRTHRGDPPSSFWLDVRNNTRGDVSAWLDVRREGNSSLDLGSTSPDCQIAQFSAFHSKGALEERYLLVVPAESTCTLRARVQVGTGEALGTHLLWLSLREN
jgi:hypothetical protein